MWTGVLLALVWLDSTAFHIIQHTPELKLATWTGDPQLFLNSGVHLAAGVLAGIALDRRRVAGAILAAMTLLLAAGALIATGRGSIGAPLYAAGVSVYSAVLVFYPVRSGSVGLAALVYAVAGGLGSALGIGMADNLRSVPGGFLLIAAGVVSMLLAGAAGSSGPEPDPTGTAGLFNNIVARRLACPGLKAFQCYVTPLPCPSCHPS